MTNRNRLERRPRGKTFSVDLRTQGTDIAKAFLGGALRSGSLWMFTSVPAPPASPRDGARTTPRGHPYVFAPELFRDVLARERTRADRFDQPFSLLLLEIDPAAGACGGSKGVPTEDAPVWRHAIDALTAAARDTAVLGWLKKATVLGAIVPAPIDGGDLQTLARRELTRRLDAETVARLSIRCYAYPPVVRTAEDWREAAAIFLEEHSSGQPRPAHYTIKRSLDVAGSLALLLVLSPVFLLIAALLKLTSPGPILFRQTRLGQMATPFTMLKFRTMRVDADHALHHEFVTKFIRSSAQLHPAGRKALFKLTNDPRVTPLGRILRKTSLDELPQLWNVLHGEMSLVGPRPSLSYEAEQYRPWHWRRILDAKPGMTGLWQVSGRSRTTFDEMVRLDLRYVRGCSLWTDIKILLATPRAVISGKGAG